MGAKKGDEMTIIVEDGTGRSNSETYASVAQFKSYCDARGLSYGSATDAEIEQSLRRSATWLDATYRTRFTGYRTKLRLQALEWPRTNAHDNAPLVTYIDTDAIPIEIINACIEAAVREKASPGALSPDVTPGQIKKSVAVEGAVSVEYALGTGGVQDQRPVVSVINDILGSLLATRGPVLSGTVVRG